MLTLWPNQLTPTIDNRTNYYNRVRKQWIVNSISQVHYYPTLASNGLEMLLLGMLGLLIILFLLFFLTDYVTQAHNPPASAPE